MLYIVLCYLFIFVLQVLPLGRFIIFPLLTRQFFGNPNHSLHVSRSRIYMDFYAAKIWRGFRMKGVKLEATRKCAIGSKLRLFPYNRG